MNKQTMLTQFCKELDLQKEFSVIKDLNLQIKGKFEAISQEALQWFEEIKDQQMNDTVDKNKKDGLLPQTPTMKRKLRKRKLPPIEDPEKENSALNTRSRRAASQAANLKFHQQFNMPKKLRRPSSPKAEPKTKPDAKKDAKPKERPKRGVKRVYVEQETDSEKEDVPLSEQSSTVSTVSNKPHTNKDNAQASLSLIDSSVDAQTTSTALRTAYQKSRSKKQKVRSPVIDKSVPKNDAPVTTADVVKTRSRKKAKVSSSKSPPHVGTHEHHTNKDVLVVTEGRLSAVVEQPPSPVKETMKICMVKLKRLSEKIKGCVIVTPKGTVINKDVSEDADDEQEEIVVEDEVIPPSPITKRQNDEPSTSSTGAGRNVELPAVTPHRKGNLKGIVKERVEAVEKSLKKEERAASKLQENNQKSTNGKKQPVLNDSNDMYESAESLADEIEMSPTKFAPRNGIFSSTVARTQPKQRTSKEQKGTPAAQLIVKLFSDHKKRSRSLEHVNSVSKLPVSQAGRSQVLTGFKTFIKPSAREVAIEEDKKKKRKAEDAQRIFDRAIDAAKKKDEQLKLKQAQKKKENEEKKVRAMMAKEALAKEQEVAAKAKKIEEERKAAFLKKKEEKELAEKELKREQKKQKLAEREQRRKEEEAARHAKLLAATQEPEKKADLSKGGWTAAQTTKLNLTKTVAHSSAKVADVSNKQTHMNATFEIEIISHTTAQPKAMTMSSNSYAMTPSRDEIPPMPPKSANDYGIDEVCEDDPSDDDEKPKKEIPLWARNLKRNISLECSDYISVGTRNILFGTKVFKPSAQELFGVNARQVQRRSSAIWNTPPNLHHISLLCFYCHHPIIQQYISSWMRIYLLGALAVLKLIAPL